LSALAKEISFVKNEKNKKDLKDAIKAKGLQLEKLKAHVDKSTVCSDLYNKVVLEKAIMNKELQDLENGNFLLRVKQLLPKKKTLICDYFKR
jgi:hypothetical protein